MNIEKTSLEGCYKIIPKIFKDDRGVFIKTFHYDTFIKNGLRTDFKEQYYSVSDKNVLRGMHFQLPPAAHAKLVYCTEGAVVDVVLDIRKGSSTFGNYETFNLSKENAVMVYIEEGFAHGFYSLENNTTMVYNVTSVYDPVSDSGIRWNSFGFKWPTKNSMLSERDSQFGEFCDFISPF